MAAGSACGVELGADGTLVKHHQLHMTSSPRPKQWGEGDLISVWFHLAPFNF